MGESKSILVVTYNDTDADLLGTLLDDQGYDVVTATSLSAFDERLNAHSTPNLSLVDADGFSPAIWERCKRLQRADVPFFVLSLNPDQVEQADRPVLEKPIQKGDLLGLVDSFTD